MNVWVKFNAGFQLCPLILILPPRSREADDAPALTAALHSWPIRYLSSSLDSIRTRSFGSISSLTDKKAIIKETGIKVQFCLCESGRAFRVRFGFKIDKISGLIRLDVWAF